MALRLAALEVDALCPPEVASFWSRMLGREGSLAGATVAGQAPGEFDLRFVSTRTPKTARHRMHLDLTSSCAQDQQRLVETALRLGARHCEVGQRGDEGHVVLADLEGNEFCVIEPGNVFLADTGRIGALAGEGLAEVGYFWSQALGWPLVWDQDGETAIQSPAGGTKITWGGPPVPAKHGRNRLRWSLEADHSLEAEVDRLLRLGASVLSVTAERAEFADPDDNEFVLSRVRK